MSRTFGAADARGASPSDLWRSSVRRDDGRVRQYPLSDGNALFGFWRATRIGRALGEALALQLSVKPIRPDGPLRNTLSAALAAGGRMTREGVPAGRLVRDRSGGRAWALA
jgi:hypothetical protein